jgi:hypothetical protein
VELRLWSRSSNFRLDDPVPYAGGNTLAVLMTLMVLQELSSGAWEFGMAGRVKQLNPLSKNTFGLPGFICQGPRGC